MFAWLRPQSGLEEIDIHHGQRMLLFDGMFGQITLVLSTGAFLIGYVLELGGSNKIVGVIAAVGPLSQVIQIPSIFLVERLRLRKVIVVWMALVSRLALLGIAALPWMASRGAAIPLFLLFLIIHTTFGAAVGCAFNSWIRDLIKPEQMSRFFAKRLALATLAGAVLSICGGVAVDQGAVWLQDKAAAYGLIFVMASFSGLMSIFFLIRTPEPQMPELAHQNIRRLLAEPLRDKNYLNLIKFIGWWNFAVNMAGPFFAVYLINRLGLSMTWVLGLSVLSQLSNVAFFGVWSRLSERFSNKSALAFSVPLFFITFLMWPFTTMPERYVLTLPILIVIHVMAGMSTAGVALCAGNLALKAAPYGRAASYLAMNALVAGAAACVAPVIAGFAADWFQPYELKLTLTLLQLHTAEQEFALPTIDLRGLDFVFLVAFIFGLYAIHRLLAIREEGEVSDEILRQAFLDEVRRAVRQVSTAAGVRQIVVFPFGLLMGQPPSAAATQTALATANANEDSGEAMTPS